MHTHVSLPVTVIRSVCKHDTYTTHGSSFKQITLFISINIQMHIKTTPSHWTASISCIKVGGVSPGSEFCDVIRSSSSSLRPAFDWHLHTQRERVLWNTVTRPDWRWWRKQQAVGVSRAQRLPEKASCKCGGRVAWAPDMRLFNTSEERRDRETHPRMRHHTRHRFNERKQTHEESRDEEQKMNNTHSCDILCITKGAMNWETRMPLMFFDKTLYNKNIL